MTDCCSTAEAGSTTWRSATTRALSRSELRDGQALPSISQYIDPAVNDDGSVSIYLGFSMPDNPAENWIQTDPGHGWFPIFRAYGPLEPYLD